MADEPELIVEREEGLAILRLNRPERLNALSAPLLQRLASEVPRLTRMSGIRAILIAGSGTAFCAGGDVGSMTGLANRDAILAGMRASHEWLNSLWSSEALIVTAVHGAAAGAGFGLAMTGDLIVASDAAVFKGGFATLGAAPDYGLGFTLPRAVGQVRAAEILYSDRRIDAQEALAIGMVSKVLPADGFASNARDFALEVARLPRGALLARRLLRSGEAAAFAAYLELEAQTQAEAFESSDFAEGVRAFREKRAPRFEGR